MLYNTRHIVACAVPLYICTTRESIIEQSVAIMYTDMVMLAHQLPERGIVELF